MSSTLYMDGVEVLQRDEDERECGLLFFLAIHSVGMNLVVTIDYITLSREAEEQPR